MKRTLKIEYAYPVDSLERSRCKGRNEACDEWEAFLPDKYELIGIVAGVLVAMSEKEPPLTQAMRDLAVAQAIAKRLGVAEEDIMGGETPELPYNPTQEDMLQIAMRDIRQRKKGRFQLRYNKEKKTIEAIDTAPAEEGAK